MNSELQIQPHPLVSKFLTASRKKSNSYPQQCPSDNELQHVGRNSQVFTKRKIPVRQDSQCIKLFLITFSILFIIFIAIDIRFQIDAKIQSNKSQSEQCFIDLQLNKCSQPVQALIEKCKYLEQCSVRNPQKSIRYTKILINIICQIFSLINDKIGIIGIAIILLVVLLYEGRRHYGYIEEQMKYS